VPRKRGVLPPKKRRANVGTYVHPPLTPLAPIERVVDEGALIYLAAARMALKNRIIVAALGDHADYDAGALLEAARLELERLADDNDETAERLEQEPAERESAWDDDIVLQKREDHRRRPQVLRLIAEKLRAEALSDPHLLAMIDTARTDAVDEMFRAITARLAAGAVEVDAEYESQRAGRIRDFIAFDLLGEASDDAAPASRKSRRRRRHDG
jgi:hypothetical protein